MLDSRSYLLYVRVGGFLSASELDLDCAQVDIDIFHATVGWLQNLLSTGALAAAEDYTVLVVLASPRPPIGRMSLIAERERFGIGWLSKVCCRRKILAHGHLERGVAEHGRRNLKRYVVNDWK